MKKLFYIFMLLFLMGLNTQAQKSSNPKLQLLVRNYQDSVVLRWAPTSAAQWLFASQKGYRIQKTIISKNANQGVSTLLTPNKFLPLTLEDVKKRYSKQDSYVGAAVQSLYNPKASTTFEASVGGIIQKSNEQNSRYASAMLSADYSANAATVLGLRWVDKEPKNPEDIIMYKVWVDTDAKSAIKVDTATVVLFANQFSNVYAPITAGILQGDSQVTLRWYRMSLDGEFSGYLIERSEDGKNFKTITANPYIQTPADEHTLKQDSLTYKGIPNPSSLITYIDSNLVNYRKYYYRVVGIDPFGVYSPVSEVMIGSPKDFTPPAKPKNVKIKVLDNKEVVVSWEKAGSVSDLKGYVIAKGGSVAGPFNFIKKEVLSNQNLSFTDFSPEPYTGRYYVVGAVDTAGNVNYAMPVVANIEDRTPPRALSSLSANATLQGKVTIDWPASTEPDVAVYKVYRAYRKDAKNYTLLTPFGIPNSEFTDSIPDKTLLNKQLYYKIVVVDLSNNHSDYSPAVLAKLPDSNPPTSPVFEQVLVEQNGIRLNIIPSSSDDVSLHILYKKNPKGMWDILKTFSGLLNSNINFKDSEVSSGQRYEYKVEAEDYAKLKSKPEFSQSILYVGENGKASIEGLKVNYDSNQKLVTLDWTCRSNNVSHFVVYRAENRSSLSTWQTVEKNQFSEKIEKAPQYLEYAIKVYFKDGTSYKMSESVRVETK
ncbi:MAG: fibronectin type III domain-containing protein [Flectobacillus sp.]|uniref:fibronectin type III domain-containing protein n=1 Tax=Flectobacillus sp. TaxID=50419 RepID=UPI003B9CDC5F